LRVLEVDEVAPLLGTHLRMGLFRGDDPLGYTDGSSDVIEHEREIRVVQSDGECGIYWRPTHRTPSPERVSRIKRPTPGAERLCMADSVSIATRVQLTRDGVVEYSVNDEPDSNGYHRSKITE
jgi:hypothetical protein